MPRDPYIEYIRIIKSTIGSSKIILFGGKIN